jgi:hypothetical protein
MGSMAVNFDPLALDRQTTTLEPNKAKTGTFHYVTGDVTFREPRMHTYSLILVNSRLVIFWILLPRFALISLSF